jgi:hypothetical protein
MGNKVTSQYCRDCVYRKIDTYTQSFSMISLFFYISENLHDVKLDFANANCVQSQGERMIILNIGSALCLACYCLHLIKHFQKTSIIGRI